MQQLCFITLLYIDGLKLTVRLLERTYSGTASLTKKNLVSIISTFSCCLEKIRGQAPQIFFLEMAFHFLLTLDLGLISIAKGLLDPTTTMTEAFEPENL